METPDTPYPAAETTCADKDCDRPAWLSCPKGFCLFHSPDNGRLDAAARIVWVTAREMAQAGHCHFSGWHFPPDPDLDPVWRQGGFFGATFSGGYVLFDGATFSGDAWFNGATFSVEARFDGATFSGYAGFVHATFSWDARFEGATFSGDAAFRDATFSGETRFKDARFSGYAAFRDAMFSGYASFDGATFSGDACFERATFSGETRFWDATFSRDAWFEGATFSGGAWFKGATFSGDARFRGATFEKTAWFDRTQFNANTLFRSAHFAADAGFNSSRFGPGCNILFNTSHPRPFRRPRYGESAYRFAKQAARERGDYTEAGRYHYAEQCAIEDRRKHEWRREHKRRSFWYWLGRLLFGRVVFGYGEKVSHPLLLGLAVIMACALVFGCIDGVVPDPDSPRTSLAWWQYGYFSVVTFTTLGYGDYQPRQGWPQVLAGVEAALGAALLATFVVCLTRKYMR